MTSWRRVCSRRLMALTVEGRALTEAHRKQQLAIAARAARVSKSLWSRLRVADLDASKGAWVGAQVAALELGFSESQKLAAEYVTQYRVAEGVAAGAVVAPKFPKAEMTQVMLVAGPIRVKNLIGKGASADSAHAGAFNQFSGIVRRQVLSGGRMAIDATTAADQQAIGWRRVTDGNPCTFCAMLASRGPVYQAKTAQGGVMRAARGGGEKLLYHGHCGCTAEIVYGEWIPNEREQLYIDEYEKAAKVAKEEDGAATQDTVLWRMRENGIFRDSPLSRNK